MNLTTRFKRWVRRRADMAELTSYCLTKSYARKRGNWALHNACNAAQKQLAREIAMRDLFQEPPSGGPVGRSTPDGTSFQP